MCCTEQPLVIVSWRKNGEQQAVACCFRFARPALHSGLVENLVAMYQPVNKPLPGSPEAARFIRRMSLVFIMAAFFVMTSQNVMAPNLTAIAESFGLTPAERDTVLGGYMSTAFFLIGGPMSVIVGYLVDVSNRKNLFLAVMFAGNATILLNVRGSACVRPLLGYIPYFFECFTGRSPPPSCEIPCSPAFSVAPLGMLVRSNFMLHLRPKT